MSPSVRVYDKAKYHFGGKWPKGLPAEQAYVHTGLFLAWLVHRGLLSESFSSRQLDAVEAIRRRELTGPTFFRAIDGVLDSTMLNAEAAAFCASYFDLKDGAFIDEYEDALARDLPTVYHVPDTWASYDRLALLLDQRFTEWHGRKP